MAEFEHLEEMVVGWYDRGILGCAQTKEEFIPLKSGRLSPHYANFRGVMSFSRQLEFSRKMTLERQARVRELTVEGAAFVLDGILMSRKPRFDHLGPIPQAVTQLGGAVALRAGVSTVNVRVKEGEKGYGKHKPVEGDYEKGDRVLGFDDVVTTGEAKEEFLLPMQEVGLEVPGYLVLLDRQEGGRARVEATDRELIAVVGMYQVAEILKANNRINQQQDQFIQSYLAEYGDLAA